MVSTLMPSDWASAFHFDCGHREPRSNRLLQQQIGSCDPGIHVEPIECRRHATANKKAAPA